MQHNLEYAMIAIIITLIELMIYIANRFTIKQ